MSSIVVHTCWLQSALVLIDFFENHLNALSRCFCTSSVCLSAFKNIRACELYQFLDTLTPCTKVIFGGEEETQF